MQPDELTQAARQARDNRKTQAEKKQTQDDTTTQQKLLEANRESSLRGFALLIEFLDGKTTKTEVMNQLDSVSTPDVDKVVDAVTSLEETFKAKEQDISPLVDGLAELKNELASLPKAFPKIPENKDEVSVSNLGGLADKLDEAIAAFKAIEIAPKFNPEITVSPAKVEVTKEEVKIDLSEVVEELRGVSSRLDARAEETQALPWASMEKWLQKIDERLEWIGSRPIPMGVGATTSTAAAVANVYDTAVYDTGTYS